MVLEQTLLGLGGDTELSKIRHGQVFALAHVPTEARKSRAPSSTARRGLLERHCTQGGRNPHRQIFCQRHGHDHSQPRLYAQHLEGKTDLTPVTFSILPDGQKAHST